MATVIPAFLDGNTFVHYSNATGRLISGNTGGLVKVFDPENDTEPTSIDIPENVTALGTHGDKLLVATTAGELALLTVPTKSLGSVSYQVIYKCGHVLRDVAFINDGNRSVCVGDLPVLVVVDHMDGFRTQEIALPANPTNLAYSSSGEVVAISLCNGDLHVISVINEQPTYVHTLARVLPPKTLSSSDFVDYAGAHAHEMVCTKSVWTNQGETLLVPTQNRSVDAFLRTDWSRLLQLPVSGKNIVSLAASLSLSVVSVLYEDGSIDFCKPGAAAAMASLPGAAQRLATNIAWAKNSVYYGSASGPLYSHQIRLEDADPVTSRDVELLFVDLVDERELLAKKHSLDDSHIIDEDEDNNASGYDETANGYNKYYNKSVEGFLASRRKKHKHAKHSSSPEPSIPYRIVPYSPGATPWIQSTSGAGGSKRRYIFMSSIGYVWSVCAEDQTSISVSFFDRVVNKDYHFVDQNNFDLCSMNEKGVLFGCSGFSDDQKLQRGKVFYRHHVNTSDLWERQIPLVAGEYITSVSLTSTADVESGEELIVVGTNYGYLRFFNLYGLCINLIKTSPVAATIASRLDAVFIVHRAGPNNYTYSIINVTEDYTFVQQERAIALTEDRGPLIKGLCFNEYSDPCIVAGIDDVLSILSHWREPNNARWVPLLNCKGIVTDYGLMESKRNWSCWPLGFQGEKFMAMVLKNSDAYPGFPLPLPVDFDVRMPVKCFRSLVEEKADEDDVDAKLAEIQKEDPEEEFLRASTFGKLLSASMADADNEDEQLEKLNHFSMTFDKSLLKLFNSACQSNRLNKAFSIVKLIKNDKALLAATRIGERHNFNKLVAKINRLREEIMEED